MPKFEGINLVRKKIKYLLGESEETIKNALCALSIIICIDNLWDGLIQETRRVGRYTANEHEQRLRLQDQLQELAQQHSKLEREACRSARDGVSPNDPRTLSPKIAFFIACPLLTCNTLKISELKSV